MVYLRASEFKINFHKNICLRHRFCLKHQRFCVHLTQKAKHFLAIFQEAKWNGKAKVMEKQK